jgi:hypothetical protein
MVTKTVAARPVLLAYPKRQRERACTPGQCAPASPEHQDFRCRECDALRFWRSSPTMPPADDCSHTQAGRPVPQRALHPAQAPWLQPPRWHPGPMLRGWQGFRRLPPDRTAPPVHDWRHARTPAPHLTTPSGFTTRGNGAVKASGIGTGCGVAKLDSSPDFCKNFYRACQIVKIVSASQARPRRNHVPESEFPAHQVGCSCSQPLPTSSTSMVMR